jgi:hypothetical protein
MTSRNDKIVKNLYINHGDKMTSTINKAIANNITSSTQQDAKEILNNIESQLTDAFAEDKKELGRPMTYSEMRERYG